METVFRWTPDLSIGVHEIDTQHQQMMARVSQLQEAVQEGRGETELVSIIEFAAEYVFHHFNAEEQIMLSTEFPAYEKHKAIHDEFVDELVQIVKHFEKGTKRGDLVIRIAQNLDQWIRNHIQGMDQELGAFLKARQNT